MKQMNKRIVSFVLGTFSEKRHLARLEAEKKRARLYSEIPALESIDNEIASCGLKLIKASLDDSVDYSLSVEKVKAETEALRNERKNLLLKHGFSENVCEPVYECSICNDTGYKNSEMCICLKKAVAAISYKESGLGKALGTQTFDNFNLSYYLKGNDAEGFQYMSHLYNGAKDYAENFDGKGNLLMLGSTGLGKTHLSSAIAKRIIEKGYTVVYESAQNVFDTFENKKFGKDLDADTDKFNKCDLLIVDDLGTEHITQFTVSVLYNLLNERINNCKAMIISSNLSPDELKTIYKPRIFSRLFGDFKLMNFKGMDIRLQKLGE